MATLQKRIYPVSFLDAVTVVLAHEGGYNNIKGDKGGATNYGVSLVTLTGLGSAGDLDGNGTVDVNDVRMMTRDQAIAVYYSFYWKPVYEQLPGELATKIFDLAVNMGHSRAHKIVQTAVGAIADGVFGMGTLDAVAKQIKANGVGFVLNQIRAGQASFYRSIVARDPSQAKFLKGWLARAEF